MNVELLRKAAAMPVIMADWFTETSTCGTVGCIAGNICLASGEKPWERSTLNGPYAAALADLPNRHLFFTHQWPVAFQEEYSRLDENSIQPADLISRVVEDYIATNGWE